MVVHPSGWCSTTVPSLQVNHLHCELHCQYLKAKVEILTVITVGSTQNPEYEKRVREEFQRRLKLQLEREREERMRNAAAAAGSRDGSSYDQEYERRRMQAEAEGTPIFLLILLNCISIIIERSILIT